MGTTFLFHRRIVVIQSLQKWWIEKSKSISRMFLHKWGGLDFQSTLFEAFGLTCCARLSNLAWLIILLLCLLLYHTRMINQKWFKPIVVCFSDDMSLDGAVFSNFCWTLENYAETGYERAWKLQQELNKSLDAFVSCSVVAEPPPKKTTKAKSSGPSKATCASQVATKLGMGDVRGAVTIVTSKEAILPPSQETKTKLQVKHPPRKKSEFLRVHQPQMSMAT